MLSSFAAPQDPTMLGPGLIHPRCRRIGLSRHQVLSCTTYTFDNSHAYSQAHCGLHPLLDVPHRPSALSVTLHPFTIMPRLPFMDFHTASIGQL